jgi:hypothetical protein
VFRVGWLRGGLREKGEGGEEFSLVVGAWRGVDDEILVHSLLTPEMPLSLWAVHLILWRPHGCSPTLIDDDEAVCFVV